MGSFRKGMHEKEVTRDVATYALAVDDFGLSNQIVTCGIVYPCAFCHSHGIDWSNRIVGVVLLIGYWKDGNQLMIAMNKKKCDLKGNERRRCFR